MNAKLKGLVRLQSAIIFIGVYFLLTVMLCFAFYFLKERPSLVYDSGYYLLLSNSFNANGNFSLLNFSPTIRGYFFPLILYISQMLLRLLFGNFLTSEYHILYSYFAFTLFIITAMVTVLIPEILSVRAKGMRKLYAALVFALLLFIFWRWTLFEVLTDVWAVFFASLAAYFLKIAYRKQKLISLLALYLGAGLSAYAAYNTRPVYLFSFFAFIFCIFVINIVRKDLSLLKKGLCVIAFLSGFYLLGIPQAIINENLYDKFSILVDNDGLFWDQIRWGVMAERYGLTLSEAPLTTSGLFYDYAPGTMLIDKMNAAGYGVLDFKAFFYLLFHYPFDMMSLYFSHLINILTVDKALVYGAELSDPIRLLYYVLSILLWLLAGCVFIFNRSKRQKFFVPENLFILPVLAPVIFIIPGVIETRFGMGVAFFMYAYVCYYTNYKGFFTFLRKYKGVIIFTCLTIFWFWLTMISRTLSSVGALLQ